MLAILADTFSNALRNTSILVLENTWMTPTIRGTKIFRNNLPFLKEVTPKNVFFVNAKKNLTLSLATH